MRSCYVRVGAESSHWCPLRREDTQRKTPCADRHTGKKTMCQRGGGWSKQAKELPPSEAGWGKGGLPARAFRGARPCWHIDFRLLASRTVKEAISVVLNCPVYGIVMAIRRFWPTGVLDNRKCILLWVSDGSLHNDWVNWAWKHH